MRDRQAKQTQVEGYAATVKHVATLTRDVTQRIEATRIRDSKETSQVTRQAPGSWTSASGVKSKTRDPTSAPMPKILAPVFGLRAVRGRIPTPG